MNADNWYTLSRIIIDSTSFGWAEPDFDLSAVTQIGVELVANGKAPEVRGDIMIDNIKVVEASGPERLAYWDFENGASGWEKACLVNSVEAQAGALSVVRGTDEGWIVTCDTSSTGTCYYDGITDSCVRV